MTAEAPACTTRKGRARRLAPGRPLRRADGEMRRLLLSLFLAATIPVLMFGAAAGYMVASEAQRMARQNADEAMDRVAKRVTAQIGHELGIAVSLAALPSLDGPDIARFHEEAARLVPRRALWETVSLAEPSGAQLLNLLRPAGSPLGPVSDLASLEAVVARSEPVIGGIGPVGPISGKRLISLGVPVIRDGRLRHVLIIGLSPQAVQAILAEAGAPAGWEGMILDADGQVIARSQPTGPAVEKAAPGQADAPAADDGLLNGPMPAGGVETVQRVLPGIGAWSVRFFVPRESLDAPVKRSMLLLVAAALSSLLLAGALSHLIARDLAQRRAAREERAALALAASEEGRSLAMEAAELGAWRWDAAVDRLALCPRSRALLGIGSPGARMAKEAMIAMAHPSDRARLADSLRGCLCDGEPIDMEFRLAPADSAGPEAAARWLRLKGRALVESPRIDPRMQGTSASSDTAQRAVQPGPALHGVLADATPRKLAEAERANRTRLLAAAQEVERCRIARDLHDQVGQTVTALSLGLKNLEHCVARGTQAEPLLDKVQALKELSGVIGHDIHRAAADLRPSALDDLGLGAALQAMANDCSERSGIAVSLAIEPGQRRLPMEIETALYRIAQEALTNVLKHSGARHVEMTLSHQRDAARLAVCDDGRGWAGSGADAAPDGGRRPMGLSGIRERAALLDGTAEIVAAPGAGAAIIVSLPLPSAAPAQQGAAL